MPRISRKTFVTLALAVAALGLIVSADFDAPRVVKGLAAAEDLSADGLPDVKRPVVVELYTSQGCSSCPPADALAGELAQLPGILPLSFHVDYWDYIGWKDPFATPENTKRQQQYARKLANRYVYTPQMVIDGSYDAVGFRRGEVFAAIESAAAAQSDLELSLDAATGRLTVPAGEAPSGGATLWLALYDNEHTTAIGSGENAGRKLSYFNVVRDLRVLGTWTGEAMVLDLDLAAAGAHDACVVLLQQGTNGPILSAVAMELPRH